METVISLAPDVIIDVGEMGESPADSERRRRVTESLWAQQQPGLGGAHRWRARRARRKLRRAGPSRCRCRSSDGALVSRSGRAMSEPMVRVRHVGWRPPAGPDVLQSVSIDVGPKEFVAIMGRNGAGKSTLLDIIVGLRQPTHGSVTLAGRPLDEWHPTERARVLAHLPQMLRADLSMRAEALVLMGQIPPRRPVVRVRRRLADRARGDGAV